MYNAKDKLIRDLCSVEFRTKSKTRKLIEEYTEQIITETKAVPMGVSQWKNHGMKYGYWEYLTNEVIEEYILEAKNAVKVNE